jgi:ribonuclease Z
MIKDIKLTFLGTSDAIPSAKRNHTAMLLTYKGENILIDCGEGTQRQFRKAKLNPCKITRILLTHRHADHILGLPGLLLTMGLSEYNKTLYIYGPKGTKILMKKLIDIFGINTKFKIEVKEVNGKFLESDEFFIESKKMIHSSDCNAYSFVKKGLLRIDKKKLKKSKLPKGPLLGKLSQGKNISYKGKKYLAKSLTYKEEDKKLSFIFDTLFNKKAVALAKNSNLVICESQFAADLDHMAKEKKHLTSVGAARIAKQSKSNKLILTHISQRYDSNTNLLLKEAKKIFKNSVLVKDLDSLEI